MTHDALLKKKKSSRLFVDPRLVERVWQRMSEAVEEDARIREKAASQGKRVRHPKTHWTRIVAEISSAARSGLNFYPTKEDAIRECHDTLVLDAVSWHRGVVVQRPLTLSMAMELLVKHTQGWCWGKTKRAIIYTDDWDRSINQWKMNLDVVRNSGCQVSVVLVTGESSARSLTALNF